ncbi:PqqC-like protein [Rickettsiales endosymbiont of Trichoplax sp. H2]|nr:PqqC-like protein [Rickettsiales endosymbiont of Trichoplax sp. H2]
MDLMQNFISTLFQKIKPFHLLKHPFYNKWSNGELNKEVLKEYSKQYFHHVEAFPRCISAIHSNCNELENRQVLLGNLIEEEDKENSHPDLWLKFSNGLGVDSKDVKSVKLNQETKDLIDEFLNIARSSYAKGLGSLYAYEYQIPEVAKSKIMGLSKFYGINDEETIKFFNVHINADEWHSEECLGLLKKLNSKKDQEDAIEGAHELSKLMWNFLTGVDKSTAHIQ